MEQTLAGNGGQLKEQIIGVEVFDRKPDYDPRIDPIVRVEARRLRAKLKAYYTSPGRGDQIMIVLPKGAYLPSFKHGAGDKSPLGSRRSFRLQAEIHCGPTLCEPDARRRNDYSDGLTEELIHLLTRIPNLRVVAWTTAPQLRGRERPRGIRQQLRVGTIPAARAAYPGPRG